MTSQNSSAKSGYAKHLEKFKINDKRAMFTIILCILLDSFGYSMVLPLLPGIAMDFGANDIMVGILISSNALSALICCPIWGKLSDKYGRKPILIISQVGTSVSFLILGLSDSLFVILISRILDGIFGGQIPVIRAYISDITTPQTRASNMGKIMVGFTLGMIAGPLLGGFLGVIDWRIPPYLASALSVFSIVLTLIVIVESMPEERRAEIKARFMKVQPNSEVNRKVWNEEVIIRLTQSFILSLISFIFTSSIALVLFKRYGVDVSMIGALMAVAGVGLLIYGIILMKPLIRKFGEKRILFSASILLIVIFALFPYLFEFWMVFIFVLPYAFCVAFMRPLIISNITKAVDADKQGVISGWSVNLQALSQTIAPLIATGFLQVGGLAIGLIFLDSYELIGFTSALLAFLLLLIIVIDIKRHPKLYLSEKMRKRRNARAKRRALNKKTTTAK
jgi:DHA1 family tetracycline resistance protein-like MFS transporter